MEKKWIVVGVAVTLVGVGAWLGVHALSSPPASAETEAVAVTVETNDAVIAEARVVPVQYADLSVTTAGVVDQVMIREGDTVEAGGVLLRLQSAHQMAILAQAEAELRRAQAQLDGLEAGPRPQEVMQAKASVKAAQARLAQITEDPRGEEVEAARAALTAAQSSLQHLLDGPDENEATIAAAALREKEVALQQAQWAYDEVAYGADVSASPEAAALEQATLAYEAAVADYHLAVRGPREYEVAAARVGLAQAQASLTSIVEGPSQADVDAATAEIEHAQAQLELVEAGARSEEIASAEANVAAAQATVDLARASLADTEVRAPFDGVVASVGADTGEYVTPGSVVAQVADTSGWRLETDDLTELNVVGIQTGDPVRITVDAIPDLEMTGWVTRVRPVGEDKLGDVTYTVSIQPETADARLRWNMTAAVFIDSGAGAAEVSRTGVQ